MNLDKHIQLAEIFLIANSIFAVALADARNEKLKTGISIAGFVISFGWMWCMCVPVTDKDVGQVVEVMTVLPYLAMAGWTVSAGIHAWNWSRGKDRRARLRRRFIAFGARRRVAPQND